MGIKEEKTSEIDNLIEEMTLNIFNVGSKKTNFYILKTLPTNVEKVMKDTGLTKVPVNKHLNELEKLGLLKRVKGTGKVYPTELTDFFRSLIFETEKQVKTNLINIFREKMLSN